MLVFKTVEYEQNEFQCFEGNKKNTKSSIKKYESFIKDQRSISRLDAKRTECNIKPAQ